MNALTINATEFSRGMSEFLNKVQYTGQILDIERGKRVIARVSPVSAADNTSRSPTAAVIAGFPIAQLDDLFANNAIPTDERVRMAQDVRALRSGLASKADPWGS